MQTNLDIIRAQFLKRGHQQIFNNAGQISFPRMSALRVTTQRNAIQRVACYWRKAHSRENRQKNAHSKS